jgi:hypothetical protein
VKKFIPHGVRGGSFSAERVGSHPTVGLASHSIKCSGHATAVALFTFVANTLVDTKHDVQEVLQELQD